MKQVIIFTFILCVCVILIGCNSIPSTEEALSSNPVIKNKDACETNYLTPTPSPSPSVSQAVSSEQQYTYMATIEGAAGTITKYNSTKYDGVQILYKIQCNNCGKYGSDVLYVEDLKWDSNNHAVFEGKYLCDKPFCHIDYGVADPGSFELNKAKTLYTIQVYRTPVN